MSGTYVEPIPRAESQQSAASRPRAWSRWPARIAVLLIVLWILAEGISLAIQHTRLRGILTAQIAAAMGRPVDVGSYSFSFWGGPVVEARTVSVAEDPRFGAEYFLRADSMTVRLRWRSLLRGHFEFGTLSLTRPSLNLVRNFDGDWNLAEWLPHPGGSSVARVYPGPVLPSTTSRFRHIEFDGGRINFKLQDEKLPFAFVGVTGSVDTERPGRWRINLQATPWRAAVSAQHAGFLRVAGEIGGTSSRLRPAAFNINWSDASLSDVLRLAHGDDFGIRGMLALSIDARTDDASPDGWTGNANLQFSQLHRWDLAQRADNPSFNLIARMAWSPSASLFTLAHAKIEAPHSSIDANGGYSFARAPVRSARTVSPPQAIYSTAQIDAADLMAWFRAFHAGVSDNLSARGLAQVSAAFAGWPPRLANASVSSEGLDFTGPASREYAHLGRLLFRYKSGSASLIPLNLMWGPSSAPAGAIHLELATKQSASPIPAWHISASTTQFRDVVAGATALGWNISRGWDIAGPFACDLHWQSALGAGFVPSMPYPLGWIEFGAPGKTADGAALRAPFLNLPIDHINARVDLKPGLRQIKLSSADAFGAHWTGTFDRSDPAQPWHFTLAADRLSTTALDRWLNPRWRESFLDRMLPFLNSRSPTAARPENLRADGRIAIDHFTLAPLVVSRLQGNLEIAGRHISFRDAAGEFYGGQITGSLDGNLAAVPSYRAELNFSHVDLPALTSVSSGLTGLFAGTASGQFTFDTAGLTRADLAGNLTCKGKAEVSRPRLENLNLGESLRDGAYRAGSSEFADVNAAFTCANRSITLQNLNFVYVDTGVGGTGTVDFGGKLDLTLADYSAISATSSNPSRVTGSITAPEFTRASLGASRRVR